MDAFFEMLQNVAMFVALAIPGFVLVKSKLIKSSDTGILSKLLSYVALPFFVLYSTLKIDFTGEMTVSILLLGGIGIVFTFALYLLAILFTRNETQQRKRGILQFCMIFSNSGFLGLPLAEEVFGTIEPTAKTFLIVLNIINNIYMYTLGVYMVTGDKKQMNVKKALLNPVLIAFLAGILFNLTKAAVYVPEIADYTGKIGNIVTPLSMTILGAKMADVKFAKIFTSKTMYFASAFKLVLSPILAIALMLLLRFILPINNAMILAFFVGFCTPSATLAATFSDQYDVDADTAVVSTLGSTLLSIASISLLYWGLSAILF